MTSTAEPSPAPVLPLPNQVPLSPKERTSFKHREVYHLTQLGIHTAPSLAKLIDETNPETGFGLKSPGPLGFLFFCKDLESFETLPLPPPDLQIFTTYSASLTHLSPSLSKRDIARGGGEQSRPSSAGSATGEKKEKLSLWRNSTIEKLNRKSTPEFERKSAPNALSNSQDASSAKSKGKVLTTSAQISHLALAT